MRDEALALPPYPLLFMFVLVFNKRQLLRTPEMVERFPQTPAPGHPPNDVERVSPGALELL